MRQLKPDEKKLYRNNKDSTYFDWDKKWYGVFTVGTEQIVMVGDSKKKVLKHIGNSTAILVRPN
jgi:hypothetical protein